MASYLATNPVDNHSMEADLIEFVGPKVGGVFTWIGIDN
jgi:hypothetical protein